MECSWLLYLITATFFAAIFLCRNSWWKLKWRDTNSSLPLGTFGWPLVGETIEFVLSAYSDRLETFMNTRRCLYGKVFKSHIFGCPTIVSTDAEMNKIVLQGDTRVFIPSYPKSLHKLMGESSFLFMSGSRHRRFHGMIGAFYKSEYLKAELTQEMEKYVQDCMSNWKAHHPIYIEDEAKHITLSVLLKALLSLDMGEDMQFLKDQVNIFVAGLICLPINIPGSQLYRSLQAKARMLVLVRKIIKERSEINNFSVAKDVLDVFLNDISEQFSLDQIADSIVELMTPGEDSLPGLMAILVKHLSDCPRALHQLREENMELKRLKAQRQEPLYWSDYMSLSFTQDVITETLRLGNVFVGVMRKATKDMEVKGYRIPKGWCILTYFRSIHLDESIHECPNEFNPWRWQNKEMGSSNFTPFGGGARLCPGRDLARLEASIFLHQLVTQFRWVAEDDSIISFPTLKMQRKMPIWIKKIEQC